MKMTEKLKVNRKKASSSRIIYKVQVKSFLSSGSMKADTMMTSDFFTRSCVKKLTEFKNDRFKSLKRHEMKLLQAFLLLDAKKVFKTTSRECQAHYVCSYNQNLFVRANSVSLKSPSCG